MMLFLFVSLLNVSPFASSLASDASVNASVIVTKVGDSETLSCSYQPSKDEEQSNTSCLIWTHHDVGNTDFEVYECKQGIYEMFRGRFSQQTNGTVSTLSIANITANDAGRYGCQESINMSVESPETTVIVIDGDPKCSLTAHKEFGNNNDNRVKGQAWNRIELSCIITFHGSWNLNHCIPEWREVGEEGNLHSECRFINETTVISTLTLDSKALTSNSSYICFATSTPFSCETGVISTECETNSAQLPTSVESKSMALVNSSACFSPSSSSFITLSFRLLLSLPVLLLFLNLHSC